MKTEYKNTDNNRTVTREIWGKERNGFIFNALGKNKLLFDLFNKIFYETADKTIKNYRGGFWALFSIQNGGFYLTLTKRQYPETLETWEGEKIEITKACMKCNIMALVNICEELKDKHKFKYYYSEDDYINSIPTVNKLITKLNEFINQF